MVCRAVLQVECAFIDNLNEVLRDAAVFLFLWLTTVVSFAVALFTLFKKDLDMEINDEVWSLFHRHSVICVCAVYRCRLTSTMEQSSTVSLRCLGVCSNGSLTIRFWIRRDLLL